MIQIFHFQFWQGACVQLVIFQFCLRLKSIFTLSRGIKSIFYSFIQGVLGSSSSLFGPQAHSYLSWGVRPILNCHRALSLSLILSRGLELGLLLFSDWALGPFLSFLGDQAHLVLLQACLCLSRGLQAHLVLHLRLRSILVCLEV